MLVHERFASLEYDASHCIASPWRIISVFSFVIALSIGVLGFWFGTLLRGNFWLHGFGITGGG